jgi:anti-anti-sigma regulatory factor
MTTDGPQRGRRANEHAARPPPEPNATTISLDGPIDRADISAFCRRALERIERSEGDPVVCDLGRVPRPDAVTVEALARLQLEARRHGGPQVLRGASGALRDLVAFTGLDRALPCE